MTWIEIVDTVVKISLGAVVAGAFGYLNARMGYVKDDRARFATRRRDHLEKILEMLVEIENTYIHQKGSLDDHRFYKDRDPLKSEAASREFWVLDEKIRACFAKFTHASSVLLLLGERAADAELTKYQDAIDEWLKLSGHGLEAFPDSKYNEVRASIKSAREAAFAALAAAYAST